MNGFVANIEERTTTNTHFRAVLFTGQHQQLVVMSLKPQEDIGEEVHAVVDQFLRVEMGSGKIILNGEERSIGAGDVILVPAGVRHNLINTSNDQDLKLYTVYAPPHHKDGIVHRTKADAQADTTDHL